MADAELHGKTGGIYNSAAFIRGTTISFNDVTDIISDSGNGFVTAGFANSQKITVLGSVSNDGNYTLAISGVTAGELPSSSPIPLTEAAGALVTIYLQPAGTAVAGFHSWEITKESDMVEATDFDDVGVKAFVLGGSGWSATAERNWQADDDIWKGTAVGTPRWVRFFLKYVASPANTDGNRAYYYEGISYVKTATVKMDITDIIRQTFSFQGVGALVLITRITSWP